MAFRDLPPEIQSRILEFCSPSDLAALSRVTPSGRDTVEYALYSRIQYCVRPSDLIKPSRDTENDEGSQELREDRSLLHTLANNSRKALMVRMFYVKLLDEDGAFYGSCTMKAQFILVKLAETLRKMSNLLDLRILHCQWMNNSDVLYKGTLRISEVIRFVSRSDEIDVN